MSHYWLIIRGVAGKEVFFVNEKNMKKVVEGFDTDKSIQFYTSDTKDLMDETFTIRKSEAVYGLEVRPADVPELGTGVQG